ncbi:hypothetical protein C8R42DRAFT_762826 [Lentinula raphanica]|nr:hypothetical protein C8R42DRAFT_762826 [Lentinula raphanica]
MGFYQGVTILLHWHRLQISPVTSSPMQLLALTHTHLHCRPRSALSSNFRSTRSFLQPEDLGYVGLRVPTRSRESLPGVMYWATKLMRRYVFRTISPSEETSNIYSTEEMPKSREQPHVIASGIFVQCHELASSSPLREEVDSSSSLSIFPNLAIIFPFLDNAVRKSRRPPCNRVGLDVFAMLAITRLRSLAVMPPVISRIEPSSAQRYLLLSDRYGTRILNDELYAETIIRE